MKWMKRISIWIIVSLSIQGLVLFYLNQYFSTVDSKVISKKVEDDKSDKVKNIDITVPENAENILVSYDAKYLAYYENEKLRIANCKDGSIKNIEVEEGNKISFYEWLPDRNRMLFVEKKSNDESGDLGLYSYDISKGEKVKIKDLKWDDTTSEVEDIQVSILTGVTYVKGSNREGVSSIYRFDRMGTMTKVNTIPKFVSNIELIRREDKLVYEGLVYNSIYVTGREEAITIKDVDKLMLIGTDDNDNVYLGELKDNITSKIYYGQISDDTDEWKDIDLQDPSEKKDLFVSSVGKVYQNDSLRGVVKEIKSGILTSYKGKLLQLYTKGIVTLIGNKISFVYFK
ncbi:hypothetical protein [Clostridium sp.]|uniref:hypothetical protein n=1 Tax=Clostridium sp. TaxID=1506 RepID=UPI001A3E1C95|nr:hypothetical protein [Clostridium sp.]MBK5242398.1 hypothetical protein [Clostridium sp.]